MNKQTMEQPAKAMNGQYVYEVVDNTSEETYWPCGVFLTAESAIGAIEDICDPRQFNSYGFVFSDDDLFIAEVRQRKVGISGHGERVAAFQYTRIFSDNDEDDDGKWSRKRTL